MSASGRFSRRITPEHHSDLRTLWQVNKYLWMTLGFLLLYLPLAQAQGLLEIPMWQACALFSLALLDAGARSLLAYRRNGYLPDLWSWGFTLIDITLISFAIHVTGGLKSDLWLIYFVVILFESLYSTPFQKYLITLTVALAYLMATLPHARQGALMPDSVYLRIFLSRLFFLTLVGSLAFRISRNVQESDRELSHLREQMAANEERGRIAREVHDGLGHALVSVILRLELCARLIRKSPEEAETLLKEEIPALRTAWNEGRDLAFHLRPWDTDTATEALPDALRRHLGRFAERTGVQIALKVEGTPCHLRPNAAFELIRIVQEALTNAAKHAQATSVEVTLNYPETGGVLCTIQDNGIGFIPEEKGAGFGLQTMRDRAHALGGRLTLESAPGQGAKIQVTLP